MSKKTIKEHANFIFSISIQSNEGQSYFGNLKLVYQNNEQGYKECGQRILEGIRQTFQLNELFGMELENEDVELLQVELGQLVLNAS